MSELEETKGRSKTDYQLISDINIQLIKATDQTEVLKFGKLEESGKNDNRKNSGGTIIAFQLTVQYTFQRFVVYTV